MEQQQIGKAEALKALAVDEETVLKGMGLSSLEWEVYTGEMTAKGLVLRVRNKRVGASLEQAFGGDK